MKYMEAPQDTSSYITDQVEKGNIKDIQAKEMKGRQVIDVSKPLQIEGILATS